MTTIINGITKARLVWIAGELQKLYDNGWMRYEGDPIFAGARNELADILVNAAEPESAAPQIVQTVMTDEQVQQVLASIPAAVPASDIVNAINATIAQSDAAVLGAVAGARADIMTAIVPAPTALVTPPPVPAAQ